MFEINTRSLKLAYVLAKINVTTEERLLTIQYVKPVVNLTGSLTLGASIFFFFSQSHFSIVNYLKKWSDKTEKKTKFVKPHPPLTQKEGF